MVENTKNPVRIDLNEFKLHIDLKKIHLTLLFNSPSRRFYLSVIALVVNEMKRLGKITSIPLEGHHELLALLNDTVGDSSGSSDKDHLLPRIYRKWQHALPDLENAPLFRVLGKRKEYEEGTDKAYPFTEAEKDSWANLFEYQGSEENVRLKFAIDRVGVTLDEIVIVYGDFFGGDAWDKFVLSLKEKGQDLTKAGAFPPEAPGPPVLPIKEQKTPWQGRHRWTVLVVSIFVIGVATILAWKLYLKPALEKKASVEKMAFPLPEKPSIAVLPFVNMSGEPKQDVFCDGLTDTIITSLSRIPHLFVIASSSTFTYKGKPVKVQQVAEDLGVRYVLEGSMQKSEKRIRLRAQLVDAITGHHMWAESYDRSLEDIFTLQDEITSKIITSLQVELTSGEYARAAGRRTKNLQALELFWRAQYHLLRFNKKDNALTKQYAEKAIEMDPEFSSAWAELGFTHLYDSRNGWSSSREQSMKLAEEHAQKALSLNPSEPKAFLLLCVISQTKREHDKAIEYAGKAVEANPNDPFALHLLALSMRNAGRHEEAVANAREAMRLTPYYPAIFLWTLGYSSFHMRRYDDALWAGEKLLDRCRKGELPNWYGYALMVAIYSELGQEEKARKYAAEMLAANPNFNWNSIVGAYPYKNQSDVDQLLNAWRKAGLK